MKIEMSGYSTVRADVRTVQDLRDLLRFLDDNRVRRDVQLDWGEGYVYAFVVENAEAEFIQCGEHIPPDLHFDVILNTHTHPVNVPETYEEALEMALDRRPATYDWPTKDKLQRSGERVNEAVDR